jgi:hypothetical protein
MSKQAHRGTIRPINVGRAKPNTVEGQQPKPLARLGSKKAAKASYSFRFIDKLWRAN